MQFRHNLLLVLIAGFACLASATGSLHAQTWGDLEIDVLLKGEHKPAKVNVDKDPEFCGKNMLVDERLVVDPKTKAIAYFVVNLLPGTTKLAVHPDYAKAAAEKPVLTNKGCRFEPRVSAVRTGQTFVLSNSDPIAHNVKADPFDNPAFNELLPPMGKTEKKFAKPETGAVKVDCSIHGWMGSYLFVKEDPYVGISDAKGHISIKNLPTGEWTFQVWNYANLPKVTIDGKETTLPRGGKWKTTIKPGVNKYKFEVDVKDVKLN